jgi:hypothetical protein
MFMVTFYTILRVFIEKAKLLRHLEVSSSVPQNPGEEAEEIFESSPLVICCSLRLGIHQMVCEFETNNSCFRTSTLRTNNAWPQRPSSVKLRVGGQGLKFYCRL